MNNEQRLEALAWAAQQDAWVKLKPSGDNDNEALQAAFDRALRTGKRGVLLEPGVYRVDAAPRQHGLELRGAGTI